LILEDEGEIAGLTQSVLDDLYARSKDSPALRALLLECMPDEEGRDLGLATAGSHNSNGTPRLHPLVAPLAGEEADRTVLPQPVLRSDGPAAWPTSSLPNGIRSDIVSATLTAETDEGKHKVPEGVDGDDNQNAVVQGEPSADPFSATALSEEGVAAWHEHEEANRGMPGIRRGEGSDIKLDWPMDPPREIREFLAHNPPRFVASLGPDLAAALFSGPRRSTMVIARDVVDQSLEVIFLICHMYIHLALGHLRRSGFDCRLEYRPGHTPPELLRGSEYRDAENVADDGATCLWDNWYTTAYQMRPSNRTRARTALAQGEVQSQTIRAMLRNRGGVLTALWKTIDGATAPLKSTRLYPMLELLSPSVRFAGPRVVRGKDRHVYLGCIDEQGHRWKRWIPSARVLDRLGVEPRDVEPVSEQELREYDEGRILIMPEEVRQARALLQQAAWATPLPILVTHVASRSAEGRKGSEQHPAAPVCSAAACAPVLRRVPAQLHVVGDEERHAIRRRAISVGRILASGAAYAGSDADPWGCLAECILEERENRQQ